MREWVVGIDIGGTNLVVGVMPAPGGALRALRSAPTGAERGAGAVVADAARMADEAAREVLAAESGVVLGTGVGCPGPIDRAAGIVVESPNLGWRDYPLRDRLESLLDGPVVVDNDANCATYGEWWQGAGRGASSLVGITVGTGVGGGYLLDGAVVTGASGGAGEIGHTTVRVGGRRCPCGNDGCLEAYASGTAIAARARAGVKDGERSTLLELAGGDPDRITAAIVCEAVAGGDAFAAEVLTEAARFLGVGVANAVNLLNPASVVIMGGVTRAGEHLFRPLRAEVHRRAFQTLADACAILPAELPHPGVVGAAGIFMSNFQGGAARR